MMRVHSRHSKSNIMLFFYYHNILLQNKIQILYKKKPIMLHPVINGKVTTDCQKFMMALSV